MPHPPTTPTFDDAPDGLFERGHLWLLEHVAGVPIRFQLDDSGAIRFEDGARGATDGDDVPLTLRHATRHVRASLDRRALRQAVDDVEAITFFGVATTRTRIDYDWERTPPLLGTDVWDADAGAGGGSDRGAFRPPDVVVTIFDRLGLTPINDVAREVNARDFDPATVSVPDSAWYDGPAAGLVVRNKVGGRALLRHPSPGADDAGVSATSAGEELSPTSPGEVPSADPSGSDGASAEKVVESFLTRERLDRLADTLDSAGHTVSADALYERAVEAIARERPWVVRGAVDGAAFRSAVASRTRRYVGER